MAHLDPPEPTEKIPRPPVQVERPVSVPDNAAADRAVQQEPPAVSDVTEAAADSTDPPTDDAAPPPEESAVAKTVPSVSDPIPSLAVSDSALFPPAESAGPMEAVSVPEEPRSDATDQEMPLSEPEPAPLQETEKNAPSPFFPLSAASEPDADSFGEPLPVEAEPAEETPAPVSLSEASTKKNPFPPTVQEPDKDIVSAPRPADSIASNGLLSSGWKAVGESVRGTSHEKTGANCQDAHLLALMENHTLIAAISDGAGSAAQAELGSSTAVRSAVEDLRIFGTRMPWPDEDADWQKLLSVVLRRAKQAVEHEAAGCGAKPRDLASTLLIMVATPHLVAAAQIGDGAIIVGDGQGSLTALTKPQSGEYLNETIFLISPRSLEQAQTCIWRGQVMHLAAFSDGLQMLALAMNDGTPHPPFFAPLFRFVRDMTDIEEAKTQLNSFLRSPRITQRADDDLTLLLAHWPHGAA